MRSFSRLRSSKTRSRFTESHFDGLVARGGHRRPDRLNVSLREALTGILLRGHFDDPALGHGTVTVTEVRVSPDLRNAKVLVSPLPGTVDKRAMLAALRRATGLLRRRLAGEMRLRFTPFLSFVLDSRFADAERVDKILRDDAERSTNGS